MSGKYLMAATATVIALACESPQAPTGEQLAVQRSVDVLRVTGGGEYLLVAAFPMQFALSAVQQPNGAAVGEFHQKGDIDGTWVDIRGHVTCLAVDDATGRAWIGGVITSNTSDADLQEDIHQPGQDVWFRLVDYGQGNSIQPDRLTFLGFTGGGGIITSEEYCEVRIWPDDDARTHPVTSGNIQVK